MKILSFNQLAGRGGASGIAMALHRRLRMAGHESVLLVGRQTGEQSDVSLIENDRYLPAWGRFWMVQARWLNKYSGRIRGARRVSECWLPRLASPKRFWSWLAGHEDFDLAGTFHLLEQVSFVPEILHLHNLHMDCFDLRELPRLSRTVPTVITLHDTWLLAGHCAYSIGCDRWKSGCSRCPHLDYPPVIRRDGAAWNWKRKRDIYRQSHLSLVCPSQWLADKVSQSILMPGVDRLIVIPNGVDTAIFKPGDQAQARGRLGWPQDAFIVMFAANGVRQSIWKDYPTMRKAIQLAGVGVGDRAIRFFALGDSSPPEQVGCVRVEFIPYRSSLAECYQAADIYIHAARADTFPTVILEALACGKPVVATAVGGIPEQIIEGETGFLVPAGDSTSLADRIIRLVQSPELVHTMGAAASHDAAKRFTLERMVSNYIRLYHEMIKQPQ